MFGSHPEVIYLFPIFKGLTLREILCSRALHLHVKKVMSALENAVLSLNDAEKLTHYLINLGERHRPWSVKMEHFDVCQCYYYWRVWVGFLRATSRFAYLEKFSLYFSSSSFVIHVNLLHP